MSDSCIFCKIVSKNAKATIIYSDEQVTAFRDIHPVAPTHILIVPNRHIDSVNTLEVEDEQLMGHLFTVAGRLQNRKVSIRAVTASLPIQAVMAGRPFFIYMCI